MDIIVDDGGLVRAREADVLGVGSYTAFCVVFGNCDLERNCSFQLLSLKNCCAMQLTSKNCNVLSSHT